MPWLIFRKTAQQQRERDQLHRWQQLNRQSRLNLSPLDLLLWTQCPRSVAIEEDAPERTVLFRAAQKLQQQIENANASGKTATVQCFALKILQRCRRTLEPIAARVSHKAQAWALRRGLVLLIRVYRLRRGLRKT
jgi:hypothetical protein